MQAYEVQGATTIFTGKTDPVPPLMVGLHIGDSA